MFTIQSVSDEGIYYLVNGWNRHETFWAKQEDVTPEKLFRRKSDAKASLTKLLKVMRDMYGDDQLFLVEMMFKDGVWTAPETGLWPDVNRIPINVSKEETR